MNNNASKSDGADEDIKKIFQELHNLQNSLESTAGYTESDDFGASHYKYWYFKTAGHTDLDRKEELENQELKAAKTKIENKGQRIANFLLNTYCENKTKENEEKLEKKNEKIRKNIRRNKEKK